MSKETLIVVQARIPSSRFPGKIFMPLGKGNVLEHVVGACWESTLGRVVIAVPDDETKIFQSWLSNYLPNPDSEAPFFLPNDVRIYGGASGDVLSRFYEVVTRAACLAQPNIIRVTSDCPLITSKMLREVWLFFVDHDFDYVNNTTLNAGLSEESPDTYSSDTCFVDGLNIEIFTFEALEKAHAAATDPYDHEHVTPWMKRNLKCGVANVGSFFLDGKLSLDDESDYETIKAFMHLKKKGIIKWVP